MKRGHIAAMGGISSREASVAFSAANFSATGAMTWTVAAAAVRTFRYSIQGRLMTLWLNVQQGANSVIGGVVAGNNLLLTLPEGRVPAFDNVATIIGVPTALPIENVAMAMTAGVSQVTILRYSANWVLGNTGIAICGVQFEIQ
jgi:hypothetical protein